MNAAILDSLESLSEFIPPPRTGVEQLGKVKSKPRAATVGACSEIGRVNSLADLKLTRGYMSSEQYRIFAQYERRR